MILWILILFFSFVLFLIGVLYISKRITLFGIRNKYISFLIVGIFILLLTVLLNFTTAIIIFLNYLLIWILMDLIFMLIKKLRGKDFKYYIAGIMAIICSTIYVIYGIYNVYDVKETDYTFKSEKLNNDYKIALISDSHLGTTFDAEGLKEYLKDIEEKNPDLLIVAGDFVDDGTSKEDMIKACKYLGSVKTKYGVYFAHGNHDKGYYGDKRGFSVSDLEEELTSNGVKVLKDESILVNDEIYLIGRKDFEDQSRLQIKDLVKDLDNDKFMVVIDHQPTDYDNESKEKLDLVVSGHTHGGQIIPLNYLNTYLSQNDSVYGYKNIDKTNFIVTSGISDWEIKMKTGCISEYVFIDLQSN